MVYIKKAGFFRPFRYKPSPTFIFKPSTLNLELLTFNSTFNLQTFNLQPSAFNLQPNPLFLYF